MVCERSTQTARARRYLAGVQPTPIQRQEPLPVALCCRLVIAPSLRNGEAVMYLRVHFNLTGYPCPSEPALQFFDHRQRCERVVLGTGDIELARDLAERAMRALLRLTDQPGPVKRRGRSKAIGIARRRRQ